MEKENKNNLIIRVLIGIIIMLVLIILGLVVYKKLYLKEDIPNNNQVTEKQEDNNKEKDKEPEKIVLDEEDVKKWLSNNNGVIKTYFVDSANDFDFNIASKKNYESFLGWSLMFGGLYKDYSIESIALNVNDDYNYQYSYPIDFIKNLLKHLGVGLESIDINEMNNNFKGFANFSMDSNKFTIKAIATGADIFTFGELNKIYLNDNNIVINYNFKDSTGQNDEYKQIGNRELVLKKTSDGYILLKAYKVES